MTTDGQTYQILQHIKTFGSITPQEALKEYGCMRLSARIWDLRHQYHQRIKTIPMVQEVRRKRFFGLLRGKDTTIVRYAKYVID